ncbi:hypothetical protein [Embleya hyalina]|uniref:Hydrolase n=1 Tax=Embleya hyalina TaxID=516124 RepID=A0A401YEL1_9ACTN|nr:hypothetical protein [Embleya hyalina]GCD93029.1 hydrolase [Embleya hyalina]
MPVPGAPPELAGYGLGIAPWRFGCGTFWGYSASTLGAATAAYANATGGTQAAIGINLERYQTLGPEGKPLLHPIDAALLDHLEQALCGRPSTTPVTAVPWLTPVAVTPP